MSFISHNLFGGVVWGCGVFVCLFLHKLEILLWKSTLIMKSVSKQASHISCGINEPLGDLEALKNSHHRSVVLCYHVCLLPSHELSPKAEKEPAGVPCFQQCRGAHVSYSLVHEFWLGCSSPLAVIQNWK